MEELKQIIRDYYKVVNIREVGGFSGKIRNKSKIPAGAEPLQILIMKGINRIIAAGELNSFNRWLHKFERNLLQKVS